MPIINIARIQGYLLAILAVSLWAVFGNVANYLFHQGISADDLTAVRVIIATVFLWGLSGFGYLRLGKLTTVRMPEGSIPALLLFGTSLWAMMFTFYKAVYHLGVPLGILLQYTHPALIIAFGWLVLGERVKSIAFLAILSIIIGVSLIVRVFEIGETQLSIIGIMWGLSSAVANAAYLIIGNHVQKTYSHGLSIFWGFTVACLISVLWCALKGDFAYDLIFSSTANIAASLGIGLFGTLGAFALMLLATTYITPLEVGLTSGLEAVLASLFAAWWFSDYLTEVQLLGAMLILTGVSLSVLRGVRPDTD